MQISQLIDLQAFENESLAKAKIFWLRRFVVRGNWGRKTH